MRIAIIIRRLNVRGGTQRLALSLAQELKRRGHAVTLYTFIYAHDDCYPELLRGLPVVSLYKSARPRHSGIFAFFKNYLSELKDAKILAEKIDIANDVLNPHDQEAYRVAAYFKKNIKNIRSVWTMNDMPTRAFSLWRDSQFDSSISASFTKRVFNVLWDAVEIRRFINKQDAIAVLDERDRGFVEKTFSPKATVIRPSIGISSFLFRERNELAKENITILATGILLPHRRYEDLIDACALLREKGYGISLIIVGDYQATPRLYASLIQRINNKGLFNRVIFTGKVSQEILQRHYATSDIFVFPCHLQSWGIAVFEAMAAGLPVIVSKTAGASEILTHEKDALLVNPFAPHEIAEAVTRLADDAVLYNSLSQNGREFVEKNLSWSKYADAILKLFESV